MRSRARSGHQQLLNFQGSMHVTAEEIDMKSKKITPSELLMRSGRSAMAAHEGSIPESANSRIPGNEFVLCRKCVCSLVNLAATETRCRTSPSDRIRSAIRSD